MIKVIRWDFEHDGEMTENAVRSSIPVSSHDGIRLKHLASNAKGAGRGGVSLEYILSGECRYVFDDGEEVTVKAGDIVYFPGGHYTFEVLGGEEFRYIVHVELPSVH